MHMQGLMDILGQHGPWAALTGALLYVLVTQTVPVSVWKHECERAERLVGVLDEMSRSLAVLLDRSER